MVLSEPTVGMEMPLQVRKNKVSVQYAEIPTGVWPGSGKRFKKRRDYAC
jgi:hypothetical protein